MNYFENLDEIQQLLHNIGLILTIIFFGLMLVSGVIRVVYHSDWYITRRLMKMTPEERARELEKNEAEREQLVKNMTSSKENQRVIHD